MEEGLDPICPSAYPSVEPRSEDRQRLACGLGAIPPAKYQDHAAHQSQSSPHREPHYQAAPHNLGLSALEGVGEYHAFDTDLGHRIFGLEVRML